MVWLIGLELLPTFGKLGIGIWWGFVAYGQLPWDGWGNQHWNQCWRHWFHHDGDSRDSLISLLKRPFYGPNSPILGYIADSSQKIHPAADFASCINSITLRLSLCIPEPRMQNQQLQALQQQALQMQLQQNAMQQTAMQQNAMQSMSTQMPQNTSQSSTSSMQVPQTQLQVPQLQPQMGQQMPLQSPQMTQMGQQPLQQLQQAPVQLPPLACTRELTWFKMGGAGLSQAFLELFECNTQSPPFHVGRIGCWRSKPQWTGHVKVACAKMDRGHVCPDEVTTASTEPASCSHLDGTPTSLPRMVHL